MSLLLFFKGGAATTHDTSGALTGAGAQVVGAAAHVAVHSTTGVLTGQDSALAGSAARTRVHATDGALAGPDAAVAGDAARTRVHASDGTLSGAGAVVSGDAARIGAPTVHDSSGELSGPGASLSGEASRPSPPRNTGAGRRRYRVRIDDEEFSVRSPQEAAALLQQARELAEQKAEQAIERANKAKGKRKTDILKDARKALPVPRIEIDDQALMDQVNVLVGEIEILYRSTLQTIEIGALLRRVEQDEEDALLALLL